MCIHILTVTETKTNNSYMWAHHDCYFSISQDVYTHDNYYDCYALREYDTVGIANWFFHENLWCGQFRHALSKYAKKTET
jgi:hypothetical protein